MSDKYESLKDKLFKLKALADRGVGGEADKARRILRRFAARRGISLVNLDWNEKPQVARFYVGRSKLNKKLFLQCYAYVTAERTIQYRTDGAIFLIDMIPRKAAELDDLWKYRKSNMAKDIHLTKEDLERLKKSVVRQNLH